MVATTSSGKRILFIIKKRLSYGSYGVSFGLVNSAKFVADHLDRLSGVEAKVVEVLDNNAINREVSLYKPTHVIVEAIWVVPEKFQVLMSLHPLVKWIVRIHSKPAFIANEGIAFKWIPEYAKLSKQYPKRFELSVNNAEFARHLRGLYGVRVTYSPNMYSNTWRDNYRWSIPGIINIGCFGAIRPLKNHLTQAIAAIAFAKSINKILYFHINADRVEQRGDEALKNLRNLFKSQKNAYLVEHPWMPHKKFLEVASRMDIGMQVSLSETYNIVAADFVSLGIPVLVCPDIVFVPSTYYADPTSIDSIRTGLHRLYAWDNPLLTYWAKLKLQQANRRAISQWKSNVIR